MGSGCVLAVYPWAGHFSESPFSLENAGDSIIILGLFKELIFHTCKALRAAPCMCGKGSIEIDAFSDVHTAVIVIFRRQGLWKVFLNE
jgi:hypothetical protein